MTTVQPAPNPSRPIVNPVRAAVLNIRALQADLTPRQREIRETHLRQVDSLVASGAFSLAPRY